MLRPGFLGQSQARYKQQIPTKLLQLDCKAASCHGLKTSLSHFYSHTAYHRSLIGGFRHHHTLRGSPTATAGVTDAAASILPDTEQQAHGANSSSNGDGSGDGKPAVLVRPVQASDKARWLQLFKEYIAFYQATDHIADDVIELTWQRLLTGGEGSHEGLVAVMDGKVVGLAHVLLHRSTWSATYYCYLEDLFTDTQVRGQGVGAALIEAVYRLADESGATKTYWHTQETNYRARGLYDKVGRKSPYIHYERQQ